MLRKLILLVFIWGAVFGTMVQCSDTNWESLNKKALKLYEQGRYKEATVYAEKAVLVAKNELGEDHPDYAEYLNNLAAFYCSMERYYEAEPLYLQALAIRKTQLGEDHPEYAVFLNNLAALYYSMGRYDEAEPLYLQAQAIRKTQLGEDHPTYATSLNNLAALYHNMRRYDEAEPLYLQALAIQKIQLGEDHPEYAVSLNNLATLYYNMRGFDEAELLYLQALEIRKTQLGEDHPEYGVSLNNLATLYYNMRGFDEAEPLYLQALEIRKMQLGKEHPAYATSLNNLAQLYEQTFQYDKAAIFYQEIQRISEEILKSGETNREQVPRNLQASGEASLKAADTRPFIGIFSPDPLQRNERGVNRLNTANFTIKGYATAAYGIKKLQVNGQEVPVYPDGVWQYPVQLEDGENKVYIKAVAHSGDETRDTLLLHYESEQVSRSEAPRRFLLTIGINDYNYESWPSLRMPVKDARDLLGTLVEKYDISEVDTLFNQLASFTNVKDQLKHLIGTTRPQDEVIIFFAGHGEYDEDFDEDGKWILVDGRLGNASLAKAIEKMEAKHVLVLADACFSGSFYLKRGEGQEAAEARNQKRSRWVLASGSMETVLDQMPGKQNSPFAWHLIDFLQKAEGDVPLSTLRDHLETQVPKYTDQQPIAGPLKGDKGGELILRQLSN